MGDISQDNAALEKELAALRSKLPGPAMPIPDEWRTLDQAAELLGCTAFEAERAFADENMQLTRDGNGRPCIEAAALDDFVVARQEGKPARAFL